MSEKWYVSNPIRDNDKYTVYNKPFGMGDIAEVSDYDTAKRIASVPDMESEIQKLRAERDALREALGFVAHSYSDATKRAQQDDAAKNAQWWEAELGMVAWVAESTLDGFHQANASTTPQTQGEER